jgi:hypothetical protein
LDTQEDFLIKENKKHVKVKNAYALMYVIIQFPFLEMIMIICLLELKN